MYYYVLRRALRVRGRGERRRARKISRSAGHADLRETECSREPSRILRYTRSRVYAVKWRHSDKCVVINGNFTLPENRYYRMRVQTTVFTFAPPRRRFSIKGTTLSESPHSTKPPVYPRCFRTWGISRDSTEISRISWKFLDFRPFFVYFFADFFSQMFFRDKGFDAGFEIHRSFIFRIRINDRR